MPPSTSRSWRSDWFVVALPVTGAAVMLTVLGLGWVQSRRATEMVLRGEAALLVERVVRAARDLPQPPSDDGLQAIGDAEARAGLRFVAVLREDGEVVARSGPVPAALDEASALRPGDLLRDGNGAWARSQRFGARPPPARDRGEAPREDRRPPPDDDGPPPDDRRQGPRRPRPEFSLVVLFEPRLVAEADRSARATLAVGVLGAAGMVLLGVLALVLLRRNQRAQRRLEQERRLASLGAMSATVAHELRNPLAALKGHAQLLVESLESRPGERAQAERVVEGAIRLERLSASLLEMARTGTLSREVVAPGPLVRSAVLQSGGARVRVDDGAAPAAWSLDPHRFPQVILNLVDNALQAGPGLPVEIRVAADGAKLVIEVRDHGPGVPLQDRERIFEPFVTTRARGVGLGLAVARQIVELHRGTLSVSDAPGGGASFRVELPGP